MSEKTAVVFVGSSVSDMMGVVSFRKFGQREELTDEQVRDLALGGAAIVPAAEFDALGFTAAELKRHGEFGSHGQAPAEFVAKQRNAIAAHDEFRASFEKAENVEKVEEVERG